MINMKCVVVLEVKPNAQLDLADITKKVKSKIFTHYICIGCRNSDLKVNIKNGKCGCCGTIL